MEVNPSDKTALDVILKLLAARAHTYETAVQTTVCGKVGSAWQNLLTKLDFVCKGGISPKVLLYEYPEVVIVRRLLSGDEVRALLEGLVSEHSVATGTRA